MAKLYRLGILGVLLLGGVALIYAWPICKGRMTGGGSFFPTFGPQAGVRITHGFELHCDPTVSPNNLEVNWGLNGENHFHLKNSTAAVCFDTGASAAPPPNTDFTTLYGAGTGDFNGVPGAYINFQFEDHGEPGVNDAVTYMYISDANSVPVLSVSTRTLLTFGNHQAHTAPNDPGTGTCPVT